MKAIDKLENGHKEMQSAIFDMAKQQAVSNERLETMNRTIETVVVNHAGRIETLEKDKTKKDVYWKITIAVASLAFAGVCGLAWRAFVTLASGQ